MKGRFSIGGVVASITVAWSCHGDIEIVHFPPMEAGESQQRWQLTFNPGDDLSPTWSPDGESVIYSAESFGSFPEMDGLLLSVPYRRGTASMYMAEMQQSRDAWPIMAIAFTPDGQRTAHLELSRRLAEEVNCGGVSFACDGLNLALPTPTVREIAIYARDVGSTALASEVPGSQLQIPGYERRPRPEEHVPDSSIIRYYPFHAVNDQERRPVFRPSWSPEGDRIVFSDGARLLLWAPGEGEPVPIAGTDNGVAAAWGPGGDWIAYTVLPRTDSVLTSCSILGQTGEAGVCVREHWSYSPAPPGLRLVAPDGSVQVDVGDGHDPAWSPDGQTLFYSHDEWIRAYHLESRETMRVPHTESGRQPAVSPDGRFLAFTRPDYSGARSIWIARLDD